MHHAKPTARAVLIDKHEELSDDDRDEMERRFFNQLVLPNGTLKTTYTNRLPDVDSACNLLLSEIDGQVRLLDMGVSSGVTTHEWVRSLLADQIRFEMDAFDLCMDAAIVSITDKFHVLVDSTRRPLQFEVFGRAESNFVGDTLSRRVRRGVPVLALRLGFAVGDRIRGDAAPVTQVKLVSHRLKSTPNVRVFEHDLTKIDELPGKYNMIRAANILNLAYFDSSFLSAAIAKVKSKLAENGYFCVVRTGSDRENNGTIFRFSGGALEPVIQIGEGTEIAALVC